MIVRDDRDDRAHGSKDTTEEEPGDTSSVLYDPRFPGRRRGCPARQLPSLMAGPWRRHRELEEGGTTLAAVFPLSLQGTLTVDVARTWRTQSSP